MKRLVFIITLIVAGLVHHVAHADADPPTECFSSPEAVYEAHPGSRAVYTTHATWWTESSKCWFVGKPIAKPPIAKPPIAKPPIAKPPIATPTTKPRAAAAVAPTPPRHMAQALPVDVKRELPAANEKSAAVQGTYDEVTAWMRTLMFGGARVPDDSPADFEARFSAIGTTPAFSSWR